MAEMAHQRKGQEQRTSRAERHHQDRTDHMVF
jgi:hypothetical protein